MSLLSREIGRRAYENPVIPEPPNNGLVQLGSLISLSGILLHDFRKGGAAMSKIKPLPKTMAAMLLIGHGGPDKLVYQKDVVVPQPDADEVLIEITACGINNTDIWTREGAYGSEDDPEAESSFQRGETTLTFPRIQGADIVGRIAAVGADVHESRIGERVMVDFSIYNRDDNGLTDMDCANMDYIGNGRDGGFAEFTTVPADQAHAVDTDMTDAELATFCCAYMTGEHLLERANVQAGEWVLVTGASGGVGSGVVQLCRARGAVPIALTSRDKVEAVKSIGAEAVIVRGEGDLVEAAKVATGGEAVDVVIDVVAGPLFNHLLRVLRPEGRYATCGAIAGPVVQIDLRTVYLKHLQIHGSSQGTRADFQRLVQYIEQGKLKALVDGVYKLSDLHRAQSDFKAKNFVGKLVVVPDSKWHEATG